MNPFRTGKIVLFQVRFDRDWHFFELGFFVLIGIFGGLYGAFVIKFNLQVAAFRRKHLATHAISEAVILALLTAAVGFTNRFLRIDMNEMLNILFQACDGEGDYENLCQCVLCLLSTLHVFWLTRRGTSRTWAQWRMVNSLLLATVIRTGLVVISYGCKVPAGIFVPSMAVGATFGRMVGILVKALYRCASDSLYFKALKELIPNTKRTARTQLGASLRPATRTSLASRLAPTLSWARQLDLRKLALLRSDPTELTDAHILQRHHPHHGHSRRHHV